MGVPVILPHSRRVRTVLFGVLALALFAFVLPDEPKAFAQEDGNGAAPAAAGGEKEKGKPPKLIVHIVESVGWVFGILLLVISMALVIIIIMLAMDLRMGSAIPPYFMDEFAETVNNRRFKEAFDLAKNENSFVGRVIAAGMGRLQYGLEDSREAALNMVENIKAGKDQLITYLATMGTLGPMLGLVGTVFGMIQSFMVLAVPGSTPQASDLAKGISHALVVTLLGIGLSVPAIFCHAFFRNRLIRISLDVSNYADDMLTQMYHNSRKTGAPEPSKPAVSVSNAQVAATPMKKV